MELLQSWHIFVILARHNFLDMLYKLSLLVSLLFFTSPLLAQKYNYKSSSSKVLLKTQIEFKKAGANTGANKMTLALSNTESTSEFDAKTGQLTFSAPVKDFKFEQTKFQKTFQSAPMLKSKDYAFVVFKGKVVNYKRRMVRKNKSNEVTLEGMLTIRGITKPIKATGTLTRVNKTQLIGKAQFVIPDASMFASNQEEQKGLTEEAKVTVNAKVEVVYEKQAKK